MYYKWNINRKFIRKNSINSGFCFWETFEKHWPSWGLLMTRWMMATAMLQSFLIAAGCLITAMMQCLSTKFSIDVAHQCSAEPTCYKKAHVSKNPSNASLECWGWIRLPLRYLFGVMEVTTIGWMKFLRMDFHQTISLDLMSTPSVLRILVKQPKGLQNETKWDDGQHGFPEL